MRARKGPGPACLIFLVALAFGASGLSAQAAPTGQPVQGARVPQGSFVRAGGAAFLAATPPGWVMDRRSLFRQGIEALFYEAGRSFESAPARISVEPVAAAGAEAAGAEALSAASDAKAAFILETASFQQLVFWGNDEAGAAGGAAGLAGAARAPGSPAGGLTAVYWAELVAGDGTRLRIALRARDAAAREAARPALEYFVGNLVLLERDE